MAVLGLKGMFAVPRRVPDPWFVAAGDEFVRVMRMPAHRIAFFCALRQVYLDEAFGERGFWSRLPRLAVPALFIWGNSDRLVPWGFARHVEQAVPAARSVVLESCGHVPHFEHPERTCGLVREFLSGLGASAEMPGLQGDPGAGARIEACARNQPRNGPSRERAGGPSRARAQSRVVGGPPAEITRTRAGHGRARPRLHP